MNQTRVFLIFAWLMVVVLLGMEWNREKNAPDPATVAAAQPVVPAANDADLAPPAASDVPQASVPGATEGSTAAAVPAMEAAASTPRVTVSQTVEGDALRLTLRQNVPAREGTGHAAC